MPIPTSPILFYKPTTSLTGPNAPIPIPTVVQSDPGLDYEGELVAIIGTPALNVPVAAALSHVLGFAVGNDVSQRTWQLRGGAGAQWALGKSFDGWAPYGPGVVTAAALPQRDDPARLTLGTRVNGEVRQQADTADMVFGVAETVSFLSQGTTLLPGDLIFTGTPSGVAMGEKPPRWLKDGDVVEVEVEGIGMLRNTIEFVKETKPSA